MTRTKSKDRVRGTKYRVQGTAYSVRRTLYFVRCTLYFVRCTSYFVRCTLYVLLFAVLAFAAAVPVNAQEGSPVTLTAQPAFEGKFKYGEWMTVWVTLENSGPDIEGEVRAVIRGDTGQNTYVVPVSLAHGARKRLPLYVLPNNFSHQIQIELVSGEQRIQMRIVNVHPQVNINYLIGITAETRGALALLPGIRLPGGRQPVVVDAPLQSLPTRMEGLRSLDALVLNAVDTTGLTPKQIEALNGWIRQGGHLIIGGGAGAPETAAGLPAEWLPLAPADLAELDSLEGLAEFAEAPPVRVPGPFLAATGTTQGTTLAAQDGIPLVQQVHLGEGMVTFIALDLRITPFDAWTGTTIFWEAVLAPGAEYPPNLSPDTSTRQMQSGMMSTALANIPSLDLPSVKNIALLLGLYILLVGPVNYLVLRKIRKLHWGWVTIPALTLVFTALSFGIGYAMRGNDLIINKAAVIRGHEDGSAQVSTYIGVFSPASRAYQIELLGNGLPGPMSRPYDAWAPSTGGGNLTFVQSSPAGVNGLGVDQWSMQSFMVEGITENFGALHAELEIRDGHLTGTVTNQTGQPIEDVTALLGARFQTLGNLPVGGTTEVDLNLNTLHGEALPMMYADSIGTHIYGYQPTNDAYRENELKRTMLDAALNQGYGHYYEESNAPGSGAAVRAAPALLPVILFGWLDSAPPEIRIEGQEPVEHARSLFLLQTGYQFPESGDIHVPPGLIAGVVTEKPASAYPCASNQFTAVGLVEGTATFEFAIPPELADVELHTLLLGLTTDSGLNTPETALYDWETETWQPFDAISQSVTPISAPQPYISPEGRVRIRINVNENTWGACYAVSLGLEGER